MSRTKWIVLTLVFLILFGGLVFALMKVDVQQVEVVGTTIKLGLSGINTKVRDFIAGNDFLSQIGTKLPDQISTGVMIASVVSGLILAFVWLVQIFKYRSFTALDCELYAYGLVVVIAAGLYVGFNMLEINYGPALNEMGELVFSFPSSHVLLITTALGGTMLFVRAKLDSRGARAVVLTIGNLLIIVGALCRLLSGKHWATDVLGGLLLGIALLMLYEAMCCKCKFRANYYEYDE